MSIYDRCLPVKRKRVNSYSTRLPWLCESLKKSIAHKNELYKKQKKSNCPEETSHYKKYKNKLAKVLRNVERKYYASLIEQHKSDLKKSWSILKNVLNRNKFKSVNSRFKVNDTIIDNKEAVAKGFNEIMYL